MRKASISEGKTPMMLCYEVILSWRRGPALARKPIKEIFAERFVTARKKSGLSQRALAVRLEVSAASVNEWENGNSEPSFTRIAELAKLFGVEPAYFFTDPTEDSIKVAGTASVKESLDSALEIFKRATQKAAAEAAKMLTSKAERTVRVAQKNPN